MMAKGKKQRLDLWLVEHGWFDSRHKAQRAVMAGQIRLDGRVAVKASCMVSPNSVVDWHKKPGEQYASRGAYKLLKALKEFNIDPTSKTVLDLGASTGGFTEVWLRAGAAKVWAVDVGYGQLAQYLRQDEKVVVMERTNARYLEAEDVGGRIFDLFSVDVSFISLGLMFPVLAKICQPNSLGVTLIKPQFEAGRSSVGAKGVVRDPLIHEQVLKATIEKAQKNGWCCCDLTYSPITGPQGNIEFLGLWQLPEVLDSGKETQISTIEEKAIKDLVEQAHLELVKR